MHLFHLAWTIAIRCYTASPTDYCRNCSRSKMRQQVLSQEHEGVTTSPQCYMIYTGCLFDKELCSRLPVWFFSRCPDRLTEYLINDCRLVTGSQRSSDSRMCCVPRTHNRCRDRSFSASGPHLWNNHPKDLRLANLSYEHLKRQLKTHLFRDHGTL